MIDLIANGLGLQKKIKKDDTERIDPQIIRNQPAVDRCDQYCKPAQSAHSAEGVVSLNKNENTISNATADLASYAEYHASIEHPGADSMRKNCGLESFGFTEMDSLKPFDIVQCNQCEYFTPDTIGDGVGIGSCAMNIKWTSNIHGKMPLYRYADRYCVQYKQKDSIDAQDH